MRELRSAEVGPTLREPDGASLRPDGHAIEQLTGGEGGSTLEPVCLVDHVEEFPPLGESLGVFRHEGDPSVLQIGTRGGNVRRHEEVWRRPQGMAFREGFLLKDIEAGSGNLALSEGAIEVGQDDV